MGFINDAKERWRSKSPEFFKKIKKFSISLGTSAIAVWITNETLSLNLHPLVLDVVKYSIAFASAMGFTAQLTKDSSNQEDT